MALRYAMARTDTLQVFLSEFEGSIDTSHLERAVRPLPLGRKNGVFC